MINNFIYQLGKQPKQTDPRTLQLASYVSPDLVPVTQINWGEKIAQWGMLGNDTVGDCAWAGQAHAEMLWTSNSKGVPLGFTTQECVSAYSAVTGYDPAQNGPNGNPTDNGTNLLDALKYWQSPGLADQTITAFVEIQPTNTQHVQLAIDLFGCVYIGLLLPDSVLPTGEGSVPTWTVAPDGSTENAVNPDNGHCVIYSGYDQSGPVVVTWGQTLPATWEFHTSYCEEAYTMIAPGWFGPGGIDPSGVDLEALEQDLLSIGTGPPATPTVS